MRLRVYVSITAAERVEFSDIVRTLDNSTPGFVLLVLSLPAVIPTGTPIAMPAGAAMMVVGALMMIGRTEIEMPRWLARRNLTRGQLDYFVRYTAPVMAWLERLVKPRWPWMLKTRQLRIAGIMVALNGFLIFLPIPFGNTIPALAVMIMALGMMLGDGVAIVWGILVSLAALLIAAAIVGLTFAIIKDLFVWSLA